MCESGKEGIRRVSGKLEGYYTSAELLLDVCEMDGGMEMGRDSLGANSEKFEIPRRYHGSGACLLGTTAFL